MRRVPTVIAVVALAFAYAWGFFPTVGFFVGLGAVLWLSWIGGGLS